MKSFVVIFVLVSLFLCLDARKEPQEYWNSIMKDQAMPEAIKKLYGDGEDAKTERFAKDFDIKPNVIIYHSHGGDGEAASQDRTSELKKLTGLFKN